MQKVWKQMQKMQEQLSKMQEELADKTVEATAGGGVIKVVANGRQEIVAIQIAPEVLEDRDPEMLEDLLIAAINGALKRSQEMLASEMEKITGKLKLPGWP